MSYRTIEQIVYKKLLAGVVFVPLMVCVCLIFAGCDGLGKSATPNLSNKPIVFKPAGLKPQANYDNLAKILKTCFDEDRMLDLDKLKANIATLENQLKLLAITGPATSPELFKTRYQRISYWLNARAAWSIYIIYKVAENSAKLPEPSPQNKLRKFTLDGKLMTLRDIDQQLEQAGGPFAPIAAPCVDLRRAAAPEKPFAAENLTEIVKKRFMEFIDDEDRIVFDVDKKQAKFPPIIWHYRAELIAKYKRDFGGQDVSLLTAILPYLKGSALRRCENAIGYECVKNSAPGKWAIVE